MTSKITTSTPGTNVTERKKYRDASADHLSVIFQTDPAIRWVTCDLSDEEHRVYLRSWFSAIVKASDLNHAVFMEANTFAAVAIWLLPGERIDSTIRMIRAGIVPVIVKLGLGGLKRMLFDFQRSVDRLKARHLPRGQLYHYLFFIGTDADARGQGLASKMIRERQVVAQQDGLPIWLEATTAHSRDVYSRCGFTMKEELVLGRGTHGADGKRQKGGSGVTLYAMVWWPDGASDGAVQH